MKEALARQLERAGPDGIGAGMTPAEATAKGILFARAEEALRALAGQNDGGLGRPPWRARGDTRGYFVPGRIEVLGKHTDYAGGRSLLCALERGFCLLATPRADAEIRIVDAGLDSQIAFRLDGELKPAEGQWANYPMNVARRIARNFPGARRGADIAFASDLPPAAGLGSSSALIVGAFLALADVNRLSETAEYLQNIRSAEDLAGYLACVENGQNFGTLAGDRGVGTHGGSEDHTAMLCCQPGRLSLYAFQPVRRERVVALPEDFQLVIGVSGVAAEKTGAAGEAYNRASQAAQTILELWNAATGHHDISLAAALEDSRDVLKEMRGVLRRSSHGQFPARVLLDRLEQFFEENTGIIPAVAEAVARGAVEAIGHVVERSQANAERLLGNQIPETLALARSARELGAVAASAFGAGFGGSVWALVRRQESEKFTRRWEARYRAEFPAAAQRAQFFASRPGPPATRLDLA
jgi:galactokinase